MLSDIVVVTISVTSVGLARAGFGVPLILSETASFPDRVRSYGGIADVAVDFSDTTSAEYLAANACFAQTPHPTTVMIGRSALPPTQKYKLAISSVVASSPYSIKVKGKGVTPTTVTWTTPAADLSFTALNAGDVFTTVAHGMVTGDGPYRVSGGSIPTGTAVDTNYWIIRLTADTYNLATSKANALATTVMTISADGSGTLRRVQNDVICAQLVQAFNAVVGKNFTATQVTGAGETDYVEVTADATGNWFSLEILSVIEMALSQTHADPGVATTLAAITLANSDWYCLLTLYNSAAYIAAAAGYIETQQKIYLADSCDTAIITGTVANGDALDALHTLSYTRTSGWYHPSPANMLAAAEAGACLPLAPGSETWMFKTLAGVEPVALTPTHRTNITAKKANSYQNTSGLNITFNGYTADGRYIDSRRGLDSYTDDLSKSIFECLSQVKKVPFTDKGIALVENVMRGATERAIVAGIFAEFPVPTYSVPLAASVSDANKAARILPDMGVSATLAGAVQKTLVNANVSL